MEDRELRTLINRLAASAEVIVVALVALACTPAVTVPEEASSTDSLLDLVAMK